jgi:hypothetical protein
MGFQHSGTFKFYRVVSNSYTTLVSASNAISDSTYYWTRFRVTGNSTPLLQARMWQDGNTEPTSWTWSYTDSSGSAITGAGQFGLHALGATTHSFDNFSVNDTQAASSAPKLRLSDGYGGVFS